jgi:DNA repair photolyase
MNEIGITERGDAALDLGWLPWVQSGEPAILITKAPDILYTHLAYNDPQQKFNIIIHATITGMGGSFYEPNVPNKFNAIDAYTDLKIRYGIERVILRIDPVIPTSEGVDIAKNVLNMSRHRGVTGRVRVSFIDQYPHTKIRLKTARIFLPWDTFHAPLKLRQEAYEALDRPEICGEPGFTCTGCVSEFDCRTLRVAQKETSGKQREFCACLMNKKELLKNKEPCHHGCLYCYWGKVHE